MKTGQWVITRRINAKMKEDENFARFIISCYGRYLGQD